MQERHTNRNQYFLEQGITTEKYVIPYIEDIISVHQDCKVLEIGCGEGGNLMPFMSRACQVYGIELLKDQYEKALEFYKNHPQRSNLTLINSDIYNISPDSIPKFHIIMMKDVIEHIPDQMKFLGFLKNFLMNDGIIFFGFPPWRMPFGGHQQVCRSILSKIPYIHLLPNFLYSRLLKIFGEDDATIGGLLEVKSTGISINRFHQIINKNHYKIRKETYWLINPNYEVKFGLKPRSIFSFFRIPCISDFYTTAVYCVISKEI